jgi:hypothetical protein
MCQWLVSLETFPMKQYKQMKIEWFVENNIGTHAVISGIYKISFQFVLKEHEQRNVKLYP